MKKELYQTNKKNWRRFTIDGDEFIVESSAQGKISTNRYNFSDLGLLAKEQSENIYSETSASQKSIIFVSVLFFIAIMGAIPFLGSPSFGMNILGALYFICTSTVVAVLWWRVKPRDYNYLSIYLGGQKFTFYNRNKNDKSQIDEFVSELRDHQNLYLKNRALDFTDAQSKKERQQVISRLYKSEVITKEEMQRLLKTVQ